MTKNAPRGRPLKQFILDKRKAVCPVCQLPRKVREQFFRRNRRLVPQAVALDWLRQEFGVVLTAHNVLSHGKARHDFR